MPSASAKASPICIIRIVFPPAIAAKPISRGIMPRVPWRDKYRLPRRRLRRHNFPRCNGRHRLGTFSQLAFALPVLQCERQCLYRKFKGQKWLGNQITPAAER